jgi:hypothetical protein
VLLTTLTLARLSIVQARRGNTEVWHTTLSRYRPSVQSREFIQDASSFYRGSSIFGFGINGHQKGISMASRDWFAPAEPVIRLSDKAGDRMDHAGDSFFGAGKAGLGTHGNGLHSATPLQQVQIPSPTRSPAVTQTIDGFEIVSTGYYFQHESNWNQGSLQHRT